MQVQSLSQEDPLEEGMATHYSILAWRAPWIEESGRLQSTGSLRVGHDCSDLGCTNEVMGSCSISIVRLLLPTSLRSLCLSSA